MKAIKYKLGKVSITVDKNPWDIEKAYDKLTIVHDIGTDTVYLSRKPVPRGASLADKEYWMKLGINGSTSSIVIAQAFGDRENIGISQKVLTAAKQAIEESIAVLVGRVDNTYTKEEVYNKEETYSQNQLNNMITTIDSEIIIVDELPEVGTPHDVYRVIGTTSYSEWSWDGEQWQKLAETETGVDEVPTENSNNFVKSGGVFGAVDAITDKYIPTSNTVVSIYPNHLYDFGEVNSLTITFNPGTSGRLNEYKFRFRCPSMVDTLLNLPANITWMPEKLEPKAGYTYEVSIVDNLGIYGEWEAN